MTRGRRACLWGSLYGLRAALFVLLLREHLSPDTFSYARGGASWSSPVSAGMGSLFGRAGVDAVGILGAIALGAALGWCSPRWWVPVLVALSPPGWYAVQAAADAAGAAAALVMFKVGKGRRERLWSVGVVAAFHAEAALVFSAVSLCGGGRKRLALAGLVGGGLACGAMADWQTRYFLPGLALLAGGV